VHRPALFRDAYDLYRRALAADHRETLAAARSLEGELHALGLHDQARDVPFDRTALGRVSCVSPFGSAELPAFKSA
jgi:hypothetical protein